jgi:ATP-dependent DNA ligase
VRASQELVVGGFTDPQGARVGLGRCSSATTTATDLVFAGKIGTGFDTKAAAGPARGSTSSRLRAAVHEGRRAAAVAAHWVRPEIVVQVGFIEWTGNDKLRHPRCSASASTRRRDVRQGTAVITHPEKVLFPTRDHQGDLAAYYEAWPVILPHLADGR